MKKKFFIVISALLFFTNCENGDEVSGTGIVRYMDLEGGFYGIVADNGGHYLPDNLATDFRKDSLRISFEGLITDKVTVQQWGRTIKLTKIVRIQ